MSREEVERQLGKPSYSPSIRHFYYAVDAIDEKGVPFGLGMEYTGGSYREDEAEKHAIKVEGYWVGRSEGFVPAGDSGLYQTPKAERRDSHKSSRLEHLNEMACHLRLGMSRPEVERQLGKPDYSPIRGQYYYDARAADERGIPFGLVVEYRRVSYGDDQIREDYTGKLEKYEVGHIGE
jgi:hypothetical protein